MLTPSLQDYLEEMYIVNATDEIRVSDVAEVLDVSLPSVKALHNQNNRVMSYISLKSRIKLTEKGIEGNSCSKESIIKRFLRVLKIGFERKRSRTMEHYLSL